MKNTILAVIFLLGIMFTTKAQNLQFGLKGGVNFASLNGDISDDFKNRTAFHVGMLVEMKVSTNLAIQPELLYSSKGATDKEYDESLKVNYIYLPVMVKYFLNDGLSIQGGPQIGVLMSAVSEVDGGNEDFKDDLKKTDLGLNFGLGYNLTNNLNIGMRYNIGLSNINNVEGLGEVNTSTLQISLGYLF